MERIAKWRDKIEYPIITSRDLNGFKEFLRVAIIAIFSLYFFRNFATHIFFLINIVINNSHHVSSILLQTSFQ